MSRHLAWSLCIAVAASAGDVKGKVAAGDGGAADAVVYLVSPGDKVKLPVPRSSHVSQKGARFNPKLMIVQVGATVDFTNDDWVTHSVYSVSNPKKFDLGLYEKSAKKLVTFDQPGDVELMCSLHPRMRATLVVVPSAWFAAVADDGSIAIEGVPAGKYDAVLHRPGEPKDLKKSVDVPESGAVSVSF
jgi:hypothetical protein